MIKRALVLFLVGSIAGLIGWGLIEPSAPNAYDTLAWGKFELRLTACVGAVIGGLLSSVYQIYSGRKQRAWIGLLGGLVLGAFLGSAGYVTGAAISNALFPNALAIGSASPAKIPARIVALTPFGAVIGLIIGIFEFNWLRLRNGFIGGLIGALLGGILFDPISYAVGPIFASMTNREEVGIAARCVWAVLVGGGVGLMVGLIELAARQAWVRLVLGRNEGKEFMIDAPQSLIGRSERAQVPLFGDPAVAPEHAVITRHQGNYFLQSLGPPVLLNGHPIQQAPLTSGDSIQIASLTLIFMLRSGKAIRTGEAMYAPAMPAQQFAAPAAPTPYSPPQAPLMRRLLLLALSGPMSGQKFEVPGTVEIGREGGLIPLSWDTSVSRSHARIEQAGDEWSVTDVGSTNGTIVNGQKVMRKILQAGDTMQIGATQFRVEYQ